MGTLSIVSTPIGNLSDISLRAIQTLFSVDVIACEDTRRTGMLIQELTKRYIAMPEFASQIAGTKRPPKLMRYDDRTEQTATPELLDLLAQGKSVALVSDAGTPLISDPGYILVREARKHNVAVVSIPGASAVLTALAGSGLPANTFMYLGYPPEKQSKRVTLFRSLRTIHEVIATTYVLYCAPHKLRSTFDDLNQTLGDIDIVVARELTKMHEEYWTGTLTEAMQHFEDPKGEFVLLLHLSDATG
ncbi:MAG: 16S rRNA (cytidine(1402)-2'-O)-methyltransferase [Patescibacteria group bacterium]